jgi:hypothetical protein
MARSEDIKTVLAAAVLDQDFRGKLLANPETAVAGMRVELDEAQTEFFKEVCERLRAVDPAASEFANMDISLTRKLDLATGDAVGPVSFHGSTSISW